MDAATLPHHSDGVVAAALERNSKSSRQCPTSILSRRYVPDMCCVAAAMVLRLESRHPSTSESRQTLFGRFPLVCGQNQKEREMAEAGSAGVDVEALSKALGTAKLSLDQALGHIGGDVSAARLSRLDDQNTGCQNSGCGGAAALAKPLEAGQPG